jgi:hypothetical protein
MLGAPEGGGEDGGSRLRRLVFSRPAVALLATLVAYAAALAWLGEHLGDAAGGLFEPGLIEDAEGDDDGGTDDDVGLSSSTDAVRDNTNHFR